MVCKIYLRDELRTLNDQEINGIIILNNKSRKEKYIIPVPFISLK